MGAFGKSNGGGRRCAARSAMPLPAVFMTVTRTELRSLDPNAREMKVETIVAVQHGYGGGVLEPNNRSTFTDVYTKR